MSPGTDWREEDPARLTDKLDLSGIAFEFLRRNVDYQRDYALATAAAFPLREEEDARAAARWGLRFPR